MKMRRFVLCVVVFMGVEAFLFGNEKTIKNLDKNIFANNTSILKEDSLAPVLKSTKNLNEEFNIFKYWGFENEQLGNYSKEEIIEDFNPVQIIYVAPIDIVEDKINGTPTKVMRITNWANDLWHGFTMTAPTGDNFNEVYISYNWKFSNEFNSTHGGKLSGFEAYPIDQEMGPNPPGDGFGFVCKVNFSEANKIYTYHYDRTPTNGDQYPWGTTAYNYDTIYFNNGTWYNITERIVLNTFTDHIANPDGIFEVWVDGRMIFKETNLIQVSKESDNIKANGFEISNYFGGSGFEYIPQTECYGYIDNINIYIPTNDPTLGTYNTHEPEIHLITPSEITDRSVFYDKLINTPGTLSNSEYGSTYSSCRDEAYLIDAGSGNTVDFTLTNYVIGNHDYLFFYDGNTSDAKLIYMIQGDKSGFFEKISSSGRFLFVRFSSNTDEGNNGWIGSVKFSNDNGTTEPQLPLSPSKLNSTFISYTNAVINWIDLSGNEIGFQIERSGPDDFSKKDFFAVSSNITSFTDASLRMNSRYQYRVRAYNNDGFSAYSNLIEIKTLFANPPTAPSHLQSTDFTDKSITVKWNDNSTNENGFVITRSLAIDPETMVTINVEANDTSFTDNNLSPSTTYVYTVKAVNTAGVSSLSNKDVASTLSFAETQRIQDGLVAYYNFRYDPDFIIRDLSRFGDPVNLRIQNPSAVSWSSNNNLELLSNNVLVSVIPAKKIITALKSTGEITAECWIKPEEPDMSFDSRIISLGNNDSEVGFILDQNYNYSEYHKTLHYGVRLQTESTIESGYPEMAPDKSISYINMQHIAYVRDNMGKESLYMNGEKVTEGFRPSGFESWKDNFYLRIGNENDMNHPWRGTLYSVAIYNRALDLNEITRNFSVGPCDSLVHDGIDFKIDVYPNPLVDYVTISINPTEYQDFVPQTMIRVLDLHGIVYHEEILFNPNNQYLKTLDFRGFSSGIYFLQVISGKNQKTTKLIIQ